VQDTEVLVNVLYGGQSPINHCCGYCKLKGKYLTVKQMKRKECLGKQCNALAKLEVHPYWKKRDIKLQGKKSKKLEQYMHTPSFIKDINTVLSDFLGYDTSELVSGII